jgi:HAMP domain-containing protein
MSWRSANGGYGVQRRTAVVFSAVVALILAANWVMVPCAGQCSPIVILAQQFSSGEIYEVPTIAQRFLVGDNPVTLYSFSATLTSAGATSPPLSYALV